MSGINCLMGSCPKGGRGNYPRVQLFKWEIVRCAIVLGGGGGGGVCVCVWVGGGGG